MITYKFVNLVLLLVNIDTHIMCQLVPINTLPYLNNGDQLRTFFNEQSLKNESFKMDIIMVKYDVQNSDEQAELALITPSNGTKPYYVLKNYKLLFYH